MSEHDRPALRLRQGKRVLVMPLGENIRQRALPALGELRSSTGYVVREKRCRPWQVEGFFQEEGRSYFYGPAAEGRLLEEILTFSPEAAFPYLRRLLAALLVLDQEGLAHFELQTDGVLFLLSGGVLFLPPRLLSGIREIRPLAYGLGVYEFLNHPDLRTRIPEQLSFSIAVLLYTLLCRRPPFESGSGEETDTLHSQMRSRRPAPLEAALPALKPEVSRVIMRGLRQAPGTQPDLAEYSRCLEGWSGEGVYGDITDSEKELLRRQAERTAVKHQASYRRRLFWRHHGRRIAVITAAALIFGGIAASWLRNITAPPATRGFTPAEVVGAFYGSINTLNHGLMDDCTAGGAGRDMIREVTQLYVVTRVSGAYEGESRYLSADSWDARGRPPLPPDAVLYGITDLGITPLSAPPPTEAERGGEKLYLVRYEHWRTAPVEEDAGSAEAAIRSVRIEESVTVGKKRKDWFIIRIERQSEELLKS